MAKEFDVLKEQANVIKNEVEDGANTASRVGGMFEDIVDRMQSGVTEVNVSQLYPTEGIDGSNKYTLETAIAKVGEELRHAGLKVTFLNGEGTTETWEFQGGTFTSAERWIQCGANKINELEENNIKWELGNFNGSGDNVASSIYVRTKNFIKSNNSLLVYDYSKYICSVNIKRSDGIRYNVDIVPYSLIESEDNRFKIRIRKRNESELSDALEVIKDSALIIYSNNNPNCIKVDYMLDWGNIGIVEGAGKIVYLTNSNNLYITKNDGKNELTSDLSKIDLVNNCVYIYKNNVYTFNGEKLVSAKDTAIKLKGWKIQSTENLTIGDYFLDQSNKLRLVIQKGKSDIIKNTNTKFLLFNDEMLIIYNLIDDNAELFIPKISYGVVNIDAFATYYELKNKTGIGKIFYNTESGSLLLRVNDTISDSFYYSLPKYNNITYVYEGETYHYNNGKLVKDKCQLLDNTTLLETGRINGAGENGTTTDDGIRTSKITDSGIYLFIFPEELKCELNIYPTLSESRKNATFIYNFSAKVTDRIGFLRACYIRKDGEKITKETAGDFLNKIKIYRINSKSEYYDVTVAASDSNVFDKKRADIVLDGDNDTDILASLFNSYHNINVLLYGGNYNINKFFSVSDTCKVALPICDENYGTPGANIRRYINIEGYSRCSPQAEESVRLKVSQSLHNSMKNSGINYFLIAAPYEPNVQVVRAATSISLKNFNIVGYYYDKPITYVDTTRLLSQMIESVNVRSWANNIYTYDAFEITPNIECCGIRVGRGSDYGIQNYVKNLNVWYCGKGIACNGEHFVFEDVKTHHDYIGWYFGDKNTVGRFEHPNILLGCSIEGCYRLMVLSKNGITQETTYEEAHESNSSVSISTLIMIGTSSEGTWHIPTNEIIDNVSQHTKPILEIVKGAYRGRIEIDWGMNIFEDGSGDNIEFTRYSGKNVIKGKGSRITR